MYFYVYILGISNNADCTIYTDGREWLFTLLKE